MAVLNRPFDRSQARATSSIHLGPVLVVAVVAIAVVALLQVAKTSDATATSFAILRLEQERLEMEVGVRQLEADVASLASLSRIEQEAQRLGLKPPAGRSSVQISVAWPAEAEQLPTRYAPTIERELDQQNSSWWRDLLEFLPF